MVANKSAIPDGFIDIPTVSPTSLLGYMKALGLMAVAGVEGCWQEDRFYLEAESLDAIAAQFVSSYQPKPIASPWNKASGFLSGNRLDEFLKTEAGRYQALKSTYLRSNRDKRQRQQKTEVVATSLAQPPD